MTLVMVGAFIVLMILGVPVGYGLILAAAAAVLWNGFLPLSIVAQQIFDQTQSFPMLALPFFMLAGTLMLGGNLGRDLLGAGVSRHAPLARRPLSTTVVSSVVFGGVSGSAVANASALGSVLIPLAEAAGLPGAALRGKQRNLGGNRCSDPTVHPHDPLFSGQRGERGRPVRCRPAARYFDGSRLHRRVLVDFA